MKKILRLLCTSLIMLNSSIILVGCKPASLGEIWIVTDGGDLFDKAFNQQVFEGAQDFSNAFNKNKNLISNISGFEYWKNRSIRVRSIISKDSEISTLQNNYNIARYAGAKVIICAGFHHRSSLTVEIQEIYNRLGIRFILVDSLVKNPINVAGLTYASEESSYLSALVGTIWLVANHENYNNNSLKMSAYGGLPSDVVVRIMAGYYWGVYYFNKFKDSDPDILLMINKIRMSQGKKEMTAKELSSDKYKIIFDKLVNSFSGGFESGTINAKAIVLQLVNNNKNNIVFSVAGAQTIDLISAIINSSNNNSAKIIGVDIDQSKQYPYAKDYFLTSALKGIYPSIKWILWHSFNLKVNKETQEISYDSEAEKYFNGKFIYTPLQGKDYVGISNNPIITEIYQMLINNSNKYWDLALKVSQSFKKLSDDLVNNTDSRKWVNAWQNDIDGNNLKYCPEF